MRTFLSRYVLVNAPAGTGGVVATQPLVGDQRSAGALAGSLVRTIVSQACAGSAIARPSQHIFSLVVSNLIMYFLLAYRQISAA